MPSKALCLVGRAQCLTTVGLTSSNTVTKLLDDWDLVKEWLCSHHYNAWNGHHVELGKIKVHALLIVVLKGSNCFCNDLRLGVTHHLILLNHKKDHGVEVSKTHV